MRLSISLKPALFYITIFTLVAESILKYSGITWEPDEIHSNVAIMQGMTFPIVKLIIFFLIIIQLFFVTEIRKNYISAFGGLLIFSGCFWCALNFESGARLVYLDTPPALLIELGALFIILQDESRQQIIKKLCGPLAVFYTVMAICALIQFLSEFTLMRMANGNVIEYFANALFLLAIWNCTVEKKKVKIYLLYGCCSCLVLVSIFVTSRGWLLQAILLTIAVYLTNNDGTAISKLKRIVLVVIIFLILFYIASVYMGDALELILNRFDEDTRTSQLRTFFEQVPIYKLLSGQGPKATYMLSGSQYAFIDNNFLFLMFRYGIIPVIAYWSIFIKTLFLRSKTSKISAITKYKIVSLMWIIAMGGICIYYSVRMDIANIFLICAAISAITLKNNSVKLEFENN